MNRQRRNIERARVVGRKRRWQRWEALNGPLEPWQRYWSEILYDEISTRGMK